MAGHYAYNAYLQAKVQPETDPKRLILMLYEGALEHLSLTREGIEEQNARKRGEHLSRAVAIVSELYTVLDPNSTDESIDFLRGLYQAILVELAKVAVTHDVAVIQQASRYLERLKHVWEHDVMGLKPGVSPPEHAQEAASPLTVRAKLSPYGLPVAPGRQRTLSA